MKGRVFSWALICGLLYASGPIHADDNACEKGATSIKLDRTIKNQISLQATLPTSREAYQKLEISRRLPWDRYVVIVTDISRFAIGFRDPGRPQPYTCDSDTDTCTCNDILDCIKMDSSGDCKPVHDICIDPPCTCPWDH